MVLTTSANMNPEVKKLMQDAEEARGLYRTGRIGRAEAEARIKPYADAYNARSKELAKEFGVRHKAFSVISYLR